jgi:arginine utilization protein RocB
MGMPGVPDDGGGGGGGSGGGAAAADGQHAVLRQMLEDIRKQCKSLEGRLQEQKGREASAEAEIEERSQRLKDAEDKMFKSAHEVPALIIIIFVPYYAPLASLRSYSYPPPLRGRS